MASLVATPPAAAPTLQPRDGPRRPRAAERPPTLPALTGLRFLAAACVVAFHYAAWEGWPASRLRDAVSAGYLAVGLFFCLSGFVLAYAYVDGDRAAPDRRAFWATRAARLLPAYLLASLIALADVHLFRGASLAQTGLLAVVHLSMLQAWVPGWQTLVNGPAWSLSAECLFYYLFPTILPRVARARPRALVGWMVGAAAAAWIVPTLYLLAQPDPIGAPGDYTKGPWLAAAVFLPLAHLPTFVVGIAAGVLCRRRPPSPIVGARAAAGAALAITATLVLSDRAPLVSLHNAALVPLFALLFWGLSAGAGSLAALLSRPGLVLLGEASYALYILQDPVWRWYRSALGAAGLAGPGLTKELAWFPPYALLVVGLSLAVLHWVERPGRRALQGLLGR